MFLTHSSRIPRMIVICLVVLWHQLRLTLQLPKFILHKSILRVGCCTHGSKTFPFGFGFNLPISPWHAILPNAMPWTNAHMPLTSLSFWVTWIWALKIKDIGIVRRHKALLESDNARFQMRITYLHGPLQCMYVIFNVFYIQQHKTTIYFSSQAFF